MPYNEIAQPVDEVTVTDEQRTRFLAIVGQDKAIGDAKALRQAGVPGTTGQLRAHLKTDEELAEQAREARGYGTQQIRNELQKRAFAGAEDQASGRILLAMAKAHLPEYRDTSHLEVTGSGGGPVQVSHEQRLTLAHVAALAGQLNGPGPSTRRELPSASEVLAEADESQSPAGSVLPL